MIKHDRGKEFFLLIGQTDRVKEYALQALVSRNINILLVNNSNPKWLQTYVNPLNVIISDLYNIQKLTADIISYIKYHDIQISAVGTFYEPYIIQASVIASVLDLPGLSVTSAFRTSANKLIMRQVCQEAGIASPRFSVIPRLDSQSLYEMIERFGTPCVIKPITGHGSYGTYLVDGKELVEDIVKHVLNQTRVKQHEIFTSFSGNFLIEEYITGKVVSIDGLVKDKNIYYVGATEFMMGKEPNFMQDGCITPPLVDDETLDQCYKMAGKTIHALELNNCSFHSEWRLTPDGPKLLEIAGRIIGGYSPVSYKLASGIDLTNALIDIWMGKEIEIKASKQKYVMDRYIRPYKKGVFMDIENISQVKNIPQVQEIQQILETGDRVYTFPDFPGIAYWYRIVGDSHEELKQVSKYVEKTVTIKMK